MTFLLSKYFPSHKLPINVIATTDAKAALLGADFCFHAVPVQVFHYPIEISALIFTYSHGHEYVNEITYNAIGCTNL